MKNDIVVSVIIPVYNAMETIERCVDSIFGQTLDKIEVILVDDGSDDKSGELCDFYAKKDARVRVVHTFNRGLSSARNTGLSMAQGEYVAFVDSDDYIEKRMLEQLVEIAEKERVDIVISGYKYIQFNGKVQDREINLPIEKRIDNEDMKQLISENANQSFLWFVWNKLYKRRLLSEFKIKFKEELTFAEDSPFNMRAFLSANGVYYFNVSLYNYVQTKGSLIQTKYKKDLIVKLEALWREKRRICKEYGIAEYEKALSQYTIDHTIPMLLQNELAADYGLNRIKEELQKIRNSEMVDFTYKQKGLRKNKSMKMSILIFLLKHKMYTVLSLLLKKR